MNTLEKIIKKTAATTLLAGSLLFAKQLYATPSLEQPVQTPFHKVMIYKPMIQHVTNNNPEEAALLASVIYSESGGNSRAKSPSNCKGLTQLSISTSNGVEVQDYTLFTPECKLYKEKCYTLYKDSKGIILIDQRYYPYL